MLLPYRAVSAECRGFEDTHFIALKAILLASADIPASYVVQKTFPYVLTYKDRR